MEKSESQSSAQKQIQELEVHLQGEIIENPVEGEVKVSKKQLKRMQRKQKWDSEKLIKRTLKRQKEKEKKKLKKLEQKIEESQYHVKQNDYEGEKNSRKRKQQYEQKMNKGLKVVIDLQFYDLMVEKEQNSLIKQLSYCHSINRKQGKCFNLILTSTTEQRKAIFTQRYNADKWGVKMTDKNVIEQFQKEKLIYLTGDAEEEIQELDEEYVYIIGGIVDHNRLKKITYNFAKDHAIPARRLPMHNLTLKASVHLAVNHVWEWMLQRYNGLSWEEAIKSVIPLRKLQNAEEIQKLEE